MYTARGSSQKYAEDKSKKYIKTIIQNKEVALEFSKYEPDHKVNIKVGKYFYINKIFNVINFSLLRYLSEQARYPNSIELVRLNLCAIGDEGLIEFSKANWEALRFLHLGKNRITKRGLYSLVKKRMDSLTQLQLHDNLLDSDAGKPLSEAKWKKLESINLNFNNLSNQGLKAMMSCTWSNLKNLCLLSNNIGNSGISALVKINFPLLQTLLLSHNLLTNDSIKPLIKGKWKHLKCLQIDGNLLGDQAISRLWMIECSKMKKIGLFSSRTTVFDHDKPQAMQTVDGLKYLCKVTAQKLKVEIYLARVGLTSKKHFLQNTKIRQLLKMANRVEIVVCIQSFGRT